MGSRKQRLKHIQSILDCSDTEMGSKIGVSRTGYLGIIKDGDSGNLTLKHVEGLLAANNVNPMWLLYGQGEIFVNKNDNPVSYKTIICPYPANAGTVEEYSQEWVGESDRVQVPGVTVDTLSTRINLKPTAWSRSFGRATI